MLLTRRSDRQKVRWPVIAEEAYEGLDEADKVRVRRVFLQLVRPGEGTEDTRRVATAPRSARSTGP